MLQHIPSPVAARMLQEPLRQLETALKSTFRACLTGDSTPSMHSCGKDASATINALKKSFRATFRREGLEVPCGCFSTSHQWLACLLALFGPLPRARNSAQRKTTIFTVSSFTIHIHTFSRKRKEGGPTTRFPKPFFLSRPFLPTVRAAGTATAAKL